MTDETQTLELAPTAPDSSTDGALKSAIQLYHSKSYSKALNLLLPGLEKDNTGTYATFIGNCYLKLGSVNDATHYWQKAISQNPLCYQAFLGLGNVSYSLNNIKQALIYWHIAASIKPEDPQLNYNLATAYSRKDDRFLAVYYYEKFIKYTRDFEKKDFKYVTKTITTLRNKAGELLRQASTAINNDKINLAVQFYIKAINNYPLIPKVVQNIAKIFACDRNFPKAIEYYKLALKIDDKLKVCMVDIANAYMAKREYEMAYCYFMRFLQSYSNNQSSKFSEIERMAGYAKGKIRPDYDALKHFNLAVDYENNLKYREALDEYENFRLLSNDNRERVDESIKKLQLIIYPERVLIKNLISKIDEVSLKGMHEEALALCERLIVLSSINSQEFQWANKKKQEIRYTIFRISEGKK